MNGDVEVIWSGSAALLLGEAGGLDDSDLPLPRQDSRETGQVGIRGAVRELIPGLLRILLLLDGCWVGGVGVGARRAAASAAAFQQDGSRSVRVENSRSYL